MVFHVVAVGRLRDGALRDLCDGYLTRVRRSLEVVVREVADAGRAAGTPKQARTLEGERLREALPRGATVVAVTRTGRAMTSTQFARQVGRWREAARDVAFLIGGAWGLPAGLIADAGAAISLGPMTFPHELARVLLLEQLYRAGTILRGEPYHKGGDR